MRTYVSGIAIACVAILGGFAAVESAAAPTGNQTVGATAVVRVKVPNVVGFRMDRATRTLRSVGLRVNEECSGLFGCIVKSRWWVCSQTPRTGVRLAKYHVVVIYAERRGEC